MRKEDVHIFAIKEYDSDLIFNSLPSELFSAILPGYTVVLKPNWVLAEHPYHKDEWEQIITNPAIITAVLKRVVEKLSNKGKIIITDGPELNADFEKIISYQPIKEWKTITDKNNITLEIIDLREELYVQDKNVTIQKIKLPSDPRGKVLVNLIDGNSEFFGHKKSRKGYFGAGSDIKEANDAHNGHTNLYSVSRSVIEADVFINIPKLKTHKKAGITSSLKNLVGINTYRNFLPHNSIGTPSEGGDQFPSSISKSKIESRIMPLLHQYVLGIPILAKLISPIFGLGKLIFGDNRQTIRGGSWYGNDTIWRMILDINKVLLYANPDGTLRKEDSSEMKKYISIIDAIIVGEGNGPKYPDPIKVGYVIMGLNPVATDIVCSSLIRFDYKKIPSINKAFSINHYPLVDFKPEDVRIIFNEKVFSIQSIPEELTSYIKPHKGWYGHIEK